MSQKTVSPAEARKLVQDGAILVDVREADERARENPRHATSRGLPA